MIKEIVSVSQPDNGDGRTIMMMRMMKMMLEIMMVNMRMILILMVAKMRMMTVATAMRMISNNDDVDNKDDDNE